MCVEAKRSYTALMAELLLKAAPSPRIERLFYFLIMEIILTKGKISLIDDIDYYKISMYKWRTLKRNNNFYAISTGFNKTTVYMHRIITEAPYSVMIDHRDRNGLNNKRENLRIANYSQNNANKKSLKNSSSIYIGVSWNKKVNKWQTSITKNNIRYHLGYFNEETEAAIVYNNKAIQIHGEFANLNII